MIAYKVFNPNWTCRGFKYQVGETYEEDINPSVCDRGFHFCKKLADCLHRLKDLERKRQNLVTGLGKTSRTRSSKDYMISWLRN